MSILSTAFGRVTLTDEDAKAFEKQVRYGRPKEAAHQSVKNGIAAVKEFKAKGTVRFSVARKAK